MFQTLPSFSLGLLHPASWLRPPHSAAAGGVTPSFGVRQVVRSALQRLVPDDLLLIRGPTSVPAVYLTFDDGPDPIHTPPLLDALAAHGVAATFFLIGERAARAPNLVRTIAAAGHTIGHHSYHHKDPSRVTTRQLLLEVERTIGQLESTLGHRTNLFRPPRGAVTLSKLIGLWRAGQTVVLWNADPGDCRMASASQLEQWGQVRGLRAGDIVLLHDDLPHAAAALPAMVRQARSRGLRFAAISPKPAIPQACLTNGGLGPQVKATGPEALCNPCGEGRTATR